MPENRIIENRKRNAKYLDMTLEEYEKWLITKRKPKSVLLKERIKHLEIINNNLLLSLDVKNKNIWELRKQNSFLMSKIIELEQYIQKTSNEQIKALQKKLEQKEIELMNKMQELKKELELTKKIEEKFKNFLVKEFFCEKDELKNRPLQWIIDLYYEKKIADTKPKHDALLNLIDLESKAYLRSENCACGNTKSRGSKGCKKCKLKQERIRKRENMAGEEAWKELWKLLGIS